MTDPVVAAQRGDKQAFTELIEQNRQCLYKIARSYFSEPMDVDDCVAETIYLCWDKLDQLKKPEYFRTWLCRILINVCRSMLSERGRCVSFDELDDDELPAAIDTMDDFSLLVSMTDSRYRLALVLYYGEGFRIREISEITGMPEGTVSSHLKRGREQLAKRLREENLI